MIETASADHLTRHDCRRIKTKYPAPFPLPSKPSFFFPFSMITHSLGVREKSPMSPPGLDFPPPTGKGGSSSLPKCPLNVAPLQHKDILSKRCRCAWPDCDAKYDTEMELYEHLKTHWPDAQDRKARPFQCGWSTPSGHNQCGKACKSQSAFIEHITIHFDTSFRPYSCNVEGCAFTFRNRQDRRRHEADFHGLQEGRKRQASVDTSPDSHKHQQFVSAQFDGANRMAKRARSYSVPEHIFSKNGANLQSGSYPYFCGHSGSEVQFLPHPNIPFYFPATHRMRTSSLPGNHPQPIISCELKNTCSESGSVHLPSPIDTTPVDLLQSPFHLAPSPFAVESLTSPLHSSSTSTGGIRTKSPFLSADSHRLTLIDETTPLATPSVLYNAEHAALLQLGLPGGQEDATYCDTLPVLMDLGLTFKRDAGDRVLRDHFPHLARFMERLEEEVEEDLGSF